MVKQTEAIRLAEASDWRGLQRLIEKQPDLARQSDDYGMLPIHWASTENNVPLSLLNTLLEAFPQGASIKNNASLLPIHIAIRARVKAKWLAKLIEVFPEGVHVRTPNGQTVLKIARQAGLSNEAMQVLDDALNCKELSPEKDNDDNDKEEEEDDDDEDDDDTGSTSDSVVDDGEDADIFHAFDGKMSLLISGNSRASTTSATSEGGHLVIGPPGDMDNSASASGLCQGHLVSPSSTSTSSQGFNSVSSTGDTTTTTTVVPTPETSVQSESWTQMLRKSMHAPRLSGASPGSFLNQRKHSLDHQSLRRNGGIFPRRMYPIRHQSLPQIPSFVQVLNATQGGHEMDETYADAPPPSNGGMEGTQSVLEGSTSSRISEHHSEDEIHFFESPPEWKRDDECSICRASFGMFKHRHHCRNCGKSICSQHSADKKIIMTSKGFTTPQRVCVTCYAMITHNRARLSTATNNPFADNEHALDLPVQERKETTASSGVNVVNLNALATGSMRMPPPIPDGVHGLPNTNNNSSSSSSQGFRVSRRSSLPPNQAQAIAAASTQPRLASIHGHNEPSHHHHHHHRDREAMDRDREWQRELQRDQAREREKAATSSESLLLQSQLMELRLAMGSLQKQVEQLTQMNMTMQQQIFEQEEIKAETTLLITQLMTRVSMLELHRENQEQD